MKIYFYLPHNERQNILVCLTPGILSNGLNYAIPKLHDQALVEENKLNFYTELSQEFDLKRNTFIFVMSCIVGLSIYVYFYLITHYH
jgi:hypothetical protein